MYKQARIWILLSWSFLTVGILLGSWWAYHELGWGGWWFWDPVENASLMPWLLATAGIHSITNTKLNRWTFFCIQFTFIFSILGTFFVRSGLLSSVHSFATDSTRGLSLLFFLIFLLFISFMNWIFQFSRANHRQMRKDKPDFHRKSEKSHGHEVGLRAKPFQAMRLEKKAQSEAAFTSALHRKVAKAEAAFASREVKKGPQRGAWPRSGLKKAPEGLKRRSAALLMQNFYFCVICAVVFCGTAAPIFFQWFWKREIITGASFYNGTLIPLFTSVLFVLLYTHYIQFSFQKQAKSNILKRSLIKFNITEAPEIFSSEELARSGLKSIYARSDQKSAKHSLLSRISSFFRKFFSSLTREAKAEASFQAFRPFRFSFRFAPTFQAYFLFYFFIHVIICINLFGFPILNSIYAAICFLIVSCLILSQNTDQICAFSVKRSLSSLTNRLEEKAEAKAASALLEEKVLRSNSADFELPLTKQTLQHFSPNYSKFQTDRRLEKTLCANDLKRQSGGRARSEMSTAHMGLVLFLFGILFSNTHKFEYTEQLYPGSSGIRLGSQVCCLRSIDHSFAPTYHSICANLLVYRPLQWKRRHEVTAEAKAASAFTSASHEVGLKSERFSANGFEKVARSGGGEIATNQSRNVLIENTRKDTLFDAARHFKTEVCMFPEKRFYYSSQNMVATKVSIYSNLFTDFYSIIGTGSMEAGWFTTCLKLPFIFCIWLGFTLGVIGGVMSLKKQLGKSKLRWL